MLTKSLPVALIGAALATASSTSGAAAAGHTRGLEIAVPAYVAPGHPMLTGIRSAQPAASVVILNPNNGYDPFDATWQAQADTLRTATTATGGHTKVLGYVDTDHGNRSLAAVKATVDNYLRTADHKVHVDGIFFDQSGRDCGTDNALRDYYLALRTYVQETVSALDPEVEEMVVDNPGTAVADCYLEPGHRTADTFVTFENTYAAYTGAGWLGGNVFNYTVGYYSGAALDPSGTAFWHLVHTTPDATAMHDALDKAFDRGAGYAYVTDDVMLNPWDATPSWGFAAQSAYAATKG
ncbi:spherulation-specific family 4 protein [Kitasatospora sp. NPDC048540]|uniref:spherulation-specific family 4 protein n=1 Tax=unclassified Kitasatospora TaxID=2633591 RepID=UPI000A49EA4B|nr:spherulation-specific family 4 protein [Kitasatospora sp. MBT63]